MRTHRPAAVVAASAAALLALGGTAFALGATPPAPATSGATAGGVEREVGPWGAEDHDTTAPEVHHSPAPTRTAAPSPSSRGDDGPGHDAGDDHGPHGHGSDDGPGHDAGDDHGRHDG